MDLPGPMTKGQLDHTPDFCKHEHCDSGPLVSPSPRDITSVSEGERRCSSYGSEHTAYLTDTKTAYMVDRSLFLECQSLSLVSTLVQLFAVDGITDASYCVSKVQAPSNARQGDMQLFKFDCPPSALQS